MNHPCAPHCHLEDRDCHWPLCQPQTPVGDEPAPLSQLAGLLLEAGYGQIGATRAS